jgi:hypothetical protein
MRTITIVMACMLLSGCGKELSGNWKGTEIVTLENMSVKSDLKMEIVQEDDLINGTWISQYGTQTSSGVVSGLLEGDSIKNVRVRQSKSKCSYTGSLSVEEQNVVTGILLGGEECSFDAAKIELKKEE